MEELDTAGSLAIPVWTIEERCFSAALICLEGHFSLSPAMGPRTFSRIRSILARTLEKSHDSVVVREALSRNVSIWLRMTKVLAVALTSLGTRSLVPTGQSLYALREPRDICTELLLTYYASLKEDLADLTMLMHIARNLLVHEDPAVAQDICSAVHFDQMVFQTMIICISVTGKVYDGLIADEAKKTKLADLTELYKRLLVACLQQTHNWLANHDRNKMWFWFDVLFTDLNSEDMSRPLPADNPDSTFKVKAAKQQVVNWLKRNPQFCGKAIDLLEEFDRTNPDTDLGDHTGLHERHAWNWVGERARRATESLGPDSGLSAEESSVWKQDEKDDWERDRLYGRVSKELDDWWYRAYDPNVEGWSIPMAPIEAAKSRADHCKYLLIHRYAPDYLPADPGRTGEHKNGHEGKNDDNPTHHREPDKKNHHSADSDSWIWEELVERFGEGVLQDSDSDDETGEGQFVGILSEIPNLLDPTQVEALHMIVKSCITDGAGSGPTSFGENLQRARCRIFLVLESGKSLLRELLVFIAVWGKDEDSVVFQVTSQIVESIHQNGLLPYAWNSLRTQRDIISPAQTVLLRILNSLYQGHMSNPAFFVEVTKVSREASLAHFLFSIFRSRIVPECTSIMYLQGVAREENVELRDFPVDSWDMERAKEGLYEYLVFILTLAETPDFKTRLIEWEAVYDLTALLNALEAGVPKKPLVEVPKRAPTTKDISGKGGGSKNSKSPIVERPYAKGDDRGPLPQYYSAATALEPAPKFPWAGVKSLILIIMSVLLEPPRGKSSPGNPQVQAQMVKHNTILPLLNSCAFDGHNPTAKERVTICIRFLLDGCEAANHFLRSLSHATSMTPRVQTTKSGAKAAKVRVDGIQGEVNVELRPKRGEEKKKKSEGRAEKVRQTMQREVKEQAAKDAAKAKADGQQSEVSNLEEDFMA